MMTSHYLAIMALLFSSTSALNSMSLKRDAILEASASRNQVLIEEIPASEQNK